VAVFRVDDAGKRELDGESTAFLVTLLERNGLEATAARKLPASLPPTIIEAARSYAAANAGAAQVILYGEIRQEAQDAQVRLAAVDGATGKDIDNFGNLVRPASALRSVLQMTAEQLLRSVERSRAQ